MSDDEALLRALFSADGDPIRTDLLPTPRPPGHWSARAGALRELGYPVETAPGGSFRLAPPPDILVPDEIRARLGPNLFANNLLVFQSTRSTNDLILREAAHGAPEGTCAVAAVQTAGRGRQGRVWDSTQPLGLWLSCLLTPPTLQAAQRLTVVAGVALSRAVQKTGGLRVRMKWPNDLVHKGKKLAGILTETKIHPGRPPVSVVGIGCNVNHLETDFPPALQTAATSLRLLCGHPVRRADLLVSLLAELAIWVSAPWEETVAAWRDLCLITGQRVRCHRQDGTLLEGEVADLSPEGALLIRLEGGRIIPVLSGDVLPLS
jgi:BirA family biotin operon repressor/biotin-[acetyl-CoA-carboxylase] ligase